MGGKSSDPNKAAMKQQKAQMKRLDAIDIPELEQYILDNPELVGLLDAEEIGDTELGNIQEDQKLRNNQMQVLDALKERSEEGITEEDKYAMEQMLGDVSANEKSQRAAIEQDMAERGMDSSGAAIMSKIQNSQNSSNNARERAMQMAAQARQSKMQALSQLGQQSGQMAQQDYGKQANLASARDAISRSNAMNSQNVNAQNLGARQSIANQRTQTGNLNKQVGNEIAQQNFANQMSKATGQGAVANSMSSIAGNAAQKPGGLQSALGGASTGAGIGAQIGGPAGAGYGAAIGAGAGVLSSMFEDGGIARQDAVNREEKQHANFKKKYMKKVQDELLGSSAEKSIETPVYAEDGNVVQANNGLTGSSLNPSMIGSMGTLDGGSFEPLSHNDPVNATMEKPEMLQESAPKRDVVAEAVNDTEMSPVEKPEEKVSDADKKKGAAIGQGISALSKMLGGGQSAPVEYNLEAPVNTVQNIMQRQAPQQFDNPFMKMRPEYRDGGMPMYASDGNGDIVDSGMESYAGDRVDAKINDGEAILNVPQQQRFMDLVRGKISVDELGEDDIIEGVPSDYREELHDRIEGEDESGPSDTKAKGLEKLLEMLGK